MVSESTKEFTMDEISTHNTNDSCWLIIGNLKNGGPKVYDVSNYLDDHPGGAEVLLDVAGQDSDEFFEDIGHSNDAREELKRYLIGDFKMDAETLAKMEAAAEKAALAKESGGSSMMMFMIVALVAIAFGYYKTQMS